MKNLFYKNLRLSWIILVILLSVSYLTGIQFTVLTWVIFFSVIFLIVATISAIPRLFYLFFPSQEGSH